MRYRACSYDRISTRVFLCLVFDFATIQYSPLWASDLVATSSQSIAPTVEIPFRLYNSNLVIVKANIGKLRNVNMVLDTGTNPSAISIEVASRLKLAGRSESLQTLNGTMQVPSLTLPHIQLGSFHAESIRVLVHNFAPLGSTIGTSIGGILGLDILCRSPFTVDYRRKIVIFGSAAALRHSVPFASTEPFLIVRTTVNGKQFRLLPDSATWGLVLFRGRLDFAPEEIHLEQATSVFTTGGSAQLRWLHAKISMGGSDLGVHKVAIAEADGDPDFDGLLGFVGMGFHRVAFDLEKRMFSWE